MDRFSVFIFFVVHIFAQTVFKSYQKHPVFLLKMVWSIFGGIFFSFRNSSFNIIRYLSENIGINRAGPVPIDDTFGLCRAEKIGLIPIRDEKNQGLSSWKRQTPSSVKTLYTWVLYVIEIISSSTKKFTVKIYVRKIFHESL